MYLELKHEQLLKNKKLSLCMKLHGKLTWFNVKHLQFHTECNNCFNSVSWEK